MSTQPQFFFDNNLSPNLAQGMKDFGESVTHLQWEFKDRPDIADVEWIPEVSKGGWFVVSRDLRIRKNPAEVRAFKDGNLGCFFLGGKNRTRCDLIQQVVRNWPRMKELAAKTRRPFMFLVPPQGTNIDKLSL